MKGIVSPVHKGVEAEFKNHRQVRCSKGGDEADLGWTPV